MPLRSRPTHPFLSPLGRLAGLALALAALGGPAAAATTPAPAELQRTITALDQAANQKDLNATLANFATDFRSSDGLSRDSLAAGLQRLWQGFERLNYATTIERWESAGSGQWVVETATTTRGQGQNDRGPLQLEAKTRSRQTWQGGKITRQEILSERVQLSQGSQPPTVQLRLSDRLKAGQPYSFDAIVREPLGESVLAGGAIETAVEPGQYLQPAEVPLEALSTGGLFKVGRAPRAAGPRWIVAAIASDTGMTWVVQRVVVD